MSARLGPPCVRMEFRCEGTAGMACAHILFGPFDPDPESARVRGYREADFRGWVANTTGTLCNYHALERDHQRRLARQKRDQR